MENLDERKMQAVGSWVAKRKLVAKKETEIRNLRHEISELEKANPFLGNLKGLVKKEELRTKKKEKEKKIEKGKEKEMEVVPPPPSAEEKEDKKPKRKPSSSPPTEESSALIKNLKKKAAVGEKRFQSTVTETRPTPDPSGSK